MVDDTISSVLLAESVARIGKLACLEVTMIGKPYAGELHLLFDDGGQDFLLR